MSVEPYTQRRFLCKKSRISLVVSNLLLNFAPKKSIDDMTQLVVTVSDNAMLPQLKTAIRQLRGVEKVMPVRNPAMHKVCKLRQELTDRLVSLSSLHDGWDGSDSKAIDRKCISKMKAALSKATEKQLAGWTLFPDARGFLYFDYTGEQGTAGITMTGNSLVYFIQKGDVLEKNDGIPFSSSNLLSILNSVNG